MSVKFEASQVAARTPASLRSRFEASVLEKRDELVELATQLVKIDSQNPPGSTYAIASLVETVLRRVPGMEIQRIVAKEPIASVVARRCFKAGGRRLIGNGHLDTFPVGDESKWSAAPLSGSICDGRLYGRGASDMKGGLAVALLTAALLSEAEEDLRGELVLTLVGDEETGGKWGTSYLLENLAIAKGDAMMSADAGSPYVIRYGEKGPLWVEICCTGRSNHAAHVHLGRNAAESLLRVLQGILALREIDVEVPENVMRSMTDARKVSEALSGAGEFDTLRRVTVNIGKIEACTSINIIPDQARALLDIRLPAGIATDQVIAKIRSIVASEQGASFDVLNRSEPNVTLPEHEIVQLALANAKQRLGQDRVVANMRVGMSDARLYRDYGVPSIVCGPTPHNMGGADEFVLIEELFSVLYVYAMTAYDYLSCFQSGSANCVAGNAPAR
jgi:succinyl-diaminopimelate desuccinylase